MKKDSQRDNKEELKKAWGNFAGIILSPSVLVVAIATIFLIILSPNEQVNEENSAYINIITVIISIFSGIVGALISKKWTEINEAGILVTRGKSAIRGLKLLLLNINSLEHRVNIHLNRLLEEDSFSEITKNNYEEIIEKCNSLEEEALNAVEEWEDIIPEANIKTQIGIISRLKGERSNLENEIDALKKEKEESTETSEELTKELEKKEGELKSVKKELKAKERELDNSILSGMDEENFITVGKVTTDNDIIFEYKCDNCDQKYHAPSGEIAPKCPNCGTSNYVSV